MSQLQITHKVRLFIGGQTTSIQGEPVDLGGDRCFSAARKFSANEVKFISPQNLNILLDSGAYTDKNRLTFAEALNRQFEWEQAAKKHWGNDFMVEAFVSYDHLVSAWHGGGYHHEYSLTKAKENIRETVAAAQYLTSCRDTVYPRKLLLVAQGLTLDSYYQCVLDILSFAQPQDWLGLGGWSGMGRYRSWQASFLTLIEAILPLVIEAKITHIHLFGVLFLPLLKSLKQKCDRYNISLSVDSSTPILACTWGDYKKAGVRKVYWKDNVAWWQEQVANL